MHLLISLKLNYFLLLLLFYSVVGPVEAIKDLSGLMSMYVYHCLSVRNAIDLHGHGVLPFFRVESF